MDILKKLKKLRADDETESEEWETLSQYRREMVNAEIPAPFCCPALVGTGAVLLYTSDETYQAMPTWHASFQSSGQHLSAKVKCCPFCGTDLPGLVLRAHPPTPLCDSDGDYCGTCQERLMNCDCYHPFSKWEIAGAPPVFSVTALITQVIDYRTTRYLSVSRKTDPRDKGLAGGKIEPGETPAEALVRELREETGLTAVEFHPVFDALDEPSGKRCLTYRVTKYTGEIATKEAGVVEWVDADELTRTGNTFESYNKGLFQRIDPFGHYSGRG